MSSNAPAANIDHQECRRPRKRGRTLVLSCDVVSSILLNLVNPVKGTSEMQSQRLTIFPALILLIASFSATLFAQPSPKSVLRFTPRADRPIAGWSQITDCFERLDRASDRVLVQTLCQSTLKRPLIVAFISARENILALPKYKKIQQQLADPRKVINDLQRDRLFANGKTVVAISCSIHSTEIVASQMSMQLDYELATAQDAETR